MQDEYYRYISNQQEINKLDGDRVIESQSNSPETWYTPTRYEDPADAKEELAMPKEPEKRIGPIMEEKMPAFDKGPRTVQPNFGEPGGGREVSVTDPIELLGLWDFPNDEWEW